MYHLHFPSLDSTQEYIKRALAHINLSVLFYVTAGEQTKGRGRGQKVWFSPPGKNLYISFHLVTEKVANLAQLLSGSALKLLLRRGAPALFKWPNDLFVEGKKIAGALCEVVDGHAIVGLGLNVGMTEEECQKLHAASLPYGDIQKLAHELAEQFREDLDRIEELAPFINEHLAYQGKSVTVMQRGVKTTGTLLHVNDDGSLALCTTSGTIVNVFDGSLDVNL